MNWGKIIIWQRPTSFRITWVEISPFLDLSLFAGHRVLTHYSCCKRLISKTLNLMSATIKNSCAARSFLDVLIFINLPYILHTSDLYRWLLKLQQPSLFKKNIRSLPDLTRVNRNVLLTVCPFKNIYFSFNCN